MTMVPQRFHRRVRCWLSEFLYDAGPLIEQIPMQLFPSADLDFWWTIALALTDNPTSQTLLLEMFDRRTELASALLSQWHTVRQKASTADWWKAYLLRVWCL